ncbi:DUF6764 family protein [Gordonia sp. (in: high G+C Gram-positive bacteria)]|uniref:DUF6764 family protein n=1 Tax=Gordonia sp. (in: high G+C Gram-positive bacteria) TaxID=84139 RepID=UPI0016AD9D6B|nr:DUF6764 family protein [Gordonia sp. (in: high G+C Gram-positive bacteria)]NLG45221.1 hypothetical protein [Gordonia sp. (in: high G+C Gram-positive bacteria)]
MRSFVARALLGLIAVAAVFGMSAMLGGGEASAGTNCSAANNQRVEHSKGDSTCIANAGPRSRATARDKTNSGAALAVATTGGTATAENSGNNSSAVASGVNGGHGYAYSVGPHSSAVAQGRNGGTTIAVSGAAGGAFSTNDGVACLGSMAATYNTSTGRGCAKWGGLSIG